MEDPLSLLRAVLDYDPATKTRTTFHDMGDDQYIISTESDVTDLLEANKAKYNAVDERARYGETAQVVASIPLHVFFDLWRQGIARDEKAFAKWLDDPANLYYRTRPGKLSR